MIHSLIKLYLKKIYFFIKDLIDLGIIPTKKNKAEKFQNTKKNFESYGYKLLLLNEPRIKRARRIR